MKLSKKILLKTGYDMSNIVFHLGIASAAIMIVFFIAFLLGNGFKLV